MLNFRKLACPETIEEAWKLNQVRTNCVLGGTGWLKMGDRPWNTAIDLSRLGLDTIEETEEEFRIGAMVTLRQLEQHKGLNAYTERAVYDSVKHIVGTQFRNCATVGGTFWSRFGFSDVLTCFLVLDASVVLAHAGTVPLAEFASGTYPNEILTHVVVKKTALQVVYDSFRNSDTDLPVVTVAVARTEEGYRAAVGARPARAELVTAETEAELKKHVQGLIYGSNTRASGEYRAALADTLTGRCLGRLEGDEQK